MAAPLTREAQLEERVRQLEAMVNQLSTQMQRGGTGGRAGRSGIRHGSPGRRQPGDHGRPVANGRRGCAGTVAAAEPAPSTRFDIPATLERKKANVKFGPGFEIRTDDDEYIFQFHNLTQFDYRGYEQGGQGTVHDTFLIPRQWFMFSGRITKPIGYFVSFANGFDTVSLLDVFVDFDFDPRFRLRAGRFKTPFTYEFLVEPIQGLILPERSIFFNNFGQNRDLGVMAFGRLFNKTFDYAAGIFNGNRNGYVAPTDSQVRLRVHQLEAVRQRRGHAPRELQHRRLGLRRRTRPSCPSRRSSGRSCRPAGNAVAGVPFLALQQQRPRVGHAGVLGPARGLVTTSSSP